MADYSINPQFANLTGLQPLPPLDVTRGGALQFQPLQQIQVVSSRPELVAQGIAGAIQGIGQGALSGITAKWQKEEDLSKEQRKYAHELELAGAKKKSEDLDFAQKELLKFDIAHSGDADYKERRKQVEEALTGRVSAVLPQKEPSVSVKQSQEEADKEYGTQQDPMYQAALKEAQAVDAGVKLPELISEVPVKPEIASASLADVKPVSEEKATAAPALAEMKPPTEQPKDQPQVDQSKNQPPKVDMIPLPQPEYPAGAFRSRELAEQARKSIETNDHWDFKISDKPDLKGYFYIEPISKFETVTDKQRQARDDWYKQKDLELKQQKAEQDAQKTSQEMQIRQQKVKDENKVLAEHVETAATSLRELNDIISRIQKNPWSVGKISGIIAAWPFSTDAYTIRKRLDTIKSNVIINALNSMRQSSPTGAAVGNVTEKENEMFAATEGPIDPSLEAKDILPVLREIKRKRLEIYNDSIEKLKANNPEYTPPTITYPKKQNKKQETSQVEKVSVVSPDGKVGKIPKSQLEEALSKGYKLQ